MEFIDSEHKAFFDKKLKELKEYGKIDVYYKSLVYTLGICETTREHFNSIFNIKKSEININSISSAWQTGSSVKVTRMAFSLWNRCMYDSEEDSEKGEMSNGYNPSEIFCCSYAPYFWEAIKIRYPEYTRYNSESKYNNLENIVVYIRAERENSICNQKDIIENYCRKNNLTYQNVYIDEGYNATTMDRPELNKIIKDIKDNKIDKIVISSIDRITRNIKDWIALSKLCDEKEVEIISADGSLENAKKYVEALKETILFDIIKYEDKEKQYTEEDEETI